MKMRLLLPRVGNCAHVSRWDDPALGLTPLPSPTVVSIAALDAAAREASYAGA